MLDIKSLVTLIIAAALAFSRCETLKKDQKGSHHVYNNENNMQGLYKIEDSLQIEVISTVARSMILNLYRIHDDQRPYRSLNMQKEGDHFFTRLSEKEYGYYYDFSVATNDGDSFLTIDPNVKLVAPNGYRGFVATPDLANPKGWIKDDFVNFPEVTDYIVYETHIRDFTIDPSSGVRHPGKYTGFAEAGSSYMGVSTGIDHLAEMGVTHVHILPFFDFKSIDELAPDSRYNWGYEPLHYNAPEGTYASDPLDPLARVRELKQMILALHQRDIAVVMDVAYNHTSDRSTHPFELLMPGEFYRKFENGRYSDASACGNEVATEKPVVRRFILNSLKYWMQEYHIDGFRFDLMGIHDIEGMNLIARELRKINPCLLLYGEGWAAGKSPLAKSKRAVKENTRKLENIAVFSDEFRDGLKGHFSNLEEKGFVSGNGKHRESVKFGIAGAVNHPQIDYGRVNYTQKAWAAGPKQMMAYVSCHDDYTLWDKLRGANPQSSMTQLKNMHMLSSLAVLTSQGTPFLHAGAEFLRTKLMDHNSFESPDSVNSIKWNQKAENQKVVNFHKGLISLRKAHPAFHIQTAAEVRKFLRFEDVDNENIIIFRLGPHANEDSWKWIYVVLNGGARDFDYRVPFSGMKAILRSEEVNLKGFPISSDAITVQGHSGQIIFLTG